MRVDTGRLRVTHTPEGDESLTCGISSGCPLVNHLALLGSESIFGISQGPPMCAHALLAKMIPSEQSYGRLTSLPLDPLSLSQHV